MLKLKVLRCLTTTWIANATVDVAIHRPGAGKIDSATGQTTLSGYVEFSFSGLQDGDEAHVTVTPGGEDPDSSHVYYWVVPDERPAGFDVGAGDDSLCVDTWHDQGAGIITCSYHV